MLFMENKPIRSHPFCESHPIAAAILFLLAGIFLISIISSILTIPLGLTIGELYKISSFLSTGIASILFLLALKRWFSPQYKGCVRSGMSRKNTMIALLPIFVYILYVLIEQLIESNFYFKPTLEALFMALTAGIGEEAMFRASSIPIAMHYIRGNKRIWAVPLVTSAVFGFAHIVNMFGGATAGNAVLQAIVTSMAGFYFGVLYVCTGSILPGFLTHALFDFVCFAGDPTLVNGIMAGELSLFSIISNFVSTALLAAASVYLLKKFGPEMINHVWKSKWSQND